MTAQPNERVIWVEIRRHALNTADAIEQHGGNDVKWVIARKALLAICLVIEAEFRLQANGREL